MAEQEPNREEDVLKQFQQIRRRLLWLTVAVMLMVLAVLLSTAAQYGALVNYFGGDPLMWGLIGVNSAVAGFFIGWVAGRRA